MSDKKKTWERRMEDAKKKHRPKLKNWEKDGYCLERLNDFKLLAGDSVVDNVIDISRSSGDRKSSGSSSSSRRDRFDDDNHRSRVSNHSVTNRSDSSSNDDDSEKKNGKSLYQLDRISCTKITPSEFIKSYEKECLPCIITDIPREEKWPAWNSWNFDSVQSNLERENGGKKSLHSLMESYFKVGEDDDGYKVKVRLRYFLKYLELNKDDSPLYVFDSNFDSNEETKRIVTDYSVPSFFPDDLFSLVGEKVDIYIYVYVYIYTYI
jgi:histone arginine demethylase JMJD6